MAVNDPATIGTTLNDTRTIVLISGLPVVVALWSVDTSSAHTLYGSNETADL